MNVEGDPRAERPFKAEGRREKLFRPLRTSVGGRWDSREITIRLSRHPIHRFYLTCTLHREMPGERKMSLRFSRAGVNFALVPRPPKGGGMRPSIIFLLFRLLSTGVIHLLVGELLNPREILKVEKKFCRIR